MSRFARDTLYTFLTNGLKMGIGLLISVLIARVLGPEAKGAYSLVILFPMLIVTFSGLGVDFATVCLVGKSQLRSPEALGNSLVLSLGIALFSLAMGAAILVPLRDISFSSVPSLPLWLGLLLIPGLVVFGQLNMFMLSLRRVGIMNAANAGLFALLLLLLLLSFAVAKDRLTGAVMAECGGYAIASLALVMVARHQAGGISIRINPKYIRGLLSFGLKTHIGSIFGFLLYRGDVFLLGTLASTAEVGYYSVAVGIAETIWMISHAAGLALLPRVASEQNPSQLKNRTPLVSRTVLAISLVGGLAWALCGRFIIPWLYSDLYAPSSTLLLVLVPGVIALSFSRILANDIAGRGHPMVNTTIVGITLALNLALNFWLIPLYGAMGAACATAAAYSLQAVICLLAYSRISGNSIRTCILPHKSDMVMLLRSLGAFSGLSRRIESQSRD